MRKIFKMDIHRLTHSIVFYVAIAFVTVMAFAQVKSGMSSNLEGLLGIATQGGGEDFMAAAMGGGVINILISIILSLFVCGDYSGGFAKNIFTVHADPKDYILGKIVSMAAVSGFLLILYTAESCAALSILGGGVSLTGGVAGLLVFLIEKWLLSGALCAAVLMILVFTRNTAWGIFAGFLIATGGLAMGISMLSEWLGWGWLEKMFLVTISGASSLCTLTFQPMIFLRVFLAAAAWMIVTCVISRKLLLKKDI